MSLTLPAALRAGDIGAELRAAGTPITAADTIIAGLRRHHEYALLTGNVAHFSKVPQLDLDPAGGVRHAALAAWCVARLRTGSPYRLQHSRLPRQQATFGAASLGLPHRAVCIALSSSVPGTPSPAGRSCGRDRPATHRPTVG